MPQKDDRSKVKYKSASDLPPAMMARDITWSEAWPEVEINTGPGQVSNRLLLFPALHPSLPPSSSSSPLSLLFRC